MDQDESSSEVMENADLVHAVTMDSINAVIHYYYLKKNGGYKRGWD